jgi:hypothetical protein
MVAYIMYDLGLNTDLEINTPHCRLESDVHIHLQRRVKDY